MLRERSQPSLDTRPPFKKTVFCHLVKTLFEHFVYFHPSATICILPALNIQLDILGFLLICIVPCFIIVLYFHSKNE